jgi:hypothetical protein
VQRCEQRAAHALAAIRSQQPDGKLRDIGRDEAVAWVRAGKVALPRRADGGATGRAREHRRVARPAPPSKLFAKGGSAPPSPRSAGRDPPPPLPR